MKTIIELRIIIDHSEEEPPITAEDIINALGLTKASLDLEVIVTNEYTE